MKIEMDTNTADTIFVVAFIIMVIAVLFIFARYGL